MSKYFRAVRSYPINGEARFKILTADLKRNELLSLTKILPPKVCENVTLHSRREIKSEITNRMKYCKYSQTQMGNWLKAN
jgi:hypothetical protein